MSAEGASLRLSGLAEGEVTVASFAGEEALSRPYRFDLVVHSATDLLAVEPTLLGAPAALVLATEGEGPRVVPGVVTAISGDGTVYRERRRISLRLAPRLALLRRRRNSRVFQDLSPVAAINRVLDEHRVPRVWQLARTYPARAYAVQYQETDYELIARLCAEAGIFFYFRLPPAADPGAPAEMLAEQIVFADSPLCYPPLGGSLLDAMAGDGPIPAPVVPFRPKESASASAEHVFSLAYRRALRAQSVVVRDYDFARPLLDLRAEAALAPAGAEPPLAVGFARSAGPLEVYSHHGEYAETDFSEANAQVLLEGERARALVAKGAGSCRRFSPGARFRLDQHPQPDLEGQELALVRVTHRWTHPEEATEGQRGYTNVFECVPAAVPYRPRRKRRSLAQVLESAVVVGPPGEEIHTDEHGRIKVQFHWDREGRKDEQSSCWMRVSQAWAGTSWGVQLIPRVGMEVLVSFVGGDEDRPVVVGAVANAAHPPAFPLPLGKTLSGIKTQTVGGVGSNELSFEDAAGGELVTLRAQRDLREQAAHDHEVHVGGAQRVNVASAQEVAVEGERHDRVGGAETRSVGGDQLVSVGGELRVTVGGSKTEVVADQVSRRFHGSTTHDAGNATEIVEGYATLSVGTEEHPAARAVVVHGNETHDVTKTLALRSDTRLLLECGESSVTLTPEGVRIDAKKIVVKAKEKLILFGDGPAIELGKEADVLADTIKLFSKGGSIELDSSAALVDGPKVKLKSGGDAPEIQDDTEDPKTRTLQWRCLDPDLKPYKDKTYRLVTQGFKCRGTTDGDGVIEKEIPKEASVAWITLWIGDYPAGERLEYTVRLGELPPSTALLGAQIRLRNMGYYAGPETEGLTADMAVALMAFQADHRIPATGKLDGETADKLDEIHPG